MTILDQITRYKRAEIASAKAARAYCDVSHAAATAQPVRPFAGSLRAKRAVSGKPALIAEIKKASPSKGLIRADFDPPTLAKAYESAGAACLSILTDGPSFQGSAEDLVRARAAVSLPVLRKDFMFEPYQVAEARAMGADCILIIMAAVSDTEAAGLSAEARRWGMDVLIEVHNERELDRASLISGAMIGVNNRDLHSFETSLSTSERLIPHIPTERLAVAESGIASPTDVHRLSAVGAQAILVGESLMRKSDVEAATRALLSH